MVELRILWFLVGHFTAWVALVLLSVFGYKRENDAYFDEEDDFR